MLSGQRLAVDRMAAVSANIQANQFSRGVMGSTAVFGTACFGSSPDGRAEHNMSMRLLCRCLGCSSVDRTGRGYLSCRNMAKCHVCMSLVRVPSAPEPSAYEHYWHER